MAVENTIVIFNECLYISGIVIMRLKVLIILLLLSQFINNVAAEGLSIPEDKAVIQFQTKLGVVTFAHQKHADLSITQCTTCHHKSQPSDTVIKPCHECHQHDSTEPPKASKAFHTRCTGCHEYTVAGGQQAGPLKKKCKLCHIK
jgi:hypothetical protein